ncbi:MAG: S8 family serine peptidase [Eubacteriales bacterium]|nr:S8 family serine peptidase [Eubacteriales bacterium]MDD4422084.1 S8 family serine peptidase [Eubacteriales bacterium]
MKSSKIISLLICFVILIAVSSFPVSVNAAVDEQVNESVTKMLNSGEYIADEILVTLKKEVSGLYSNRQTIESVFEPISSESIVKLTDNPFADKGAEVSNPEGVLVNTDNYRDIYLLKLKDESEMKKALGILINNCDVEIAEPNYILYPDATYDPLSNNQWQLDKIGTGASWDKGFTGKSDVQVGILDTGIDTGHTDLVSNVDYTLAWDIYLNTSDVTDVNGHGTFIAGLIGADLNGSGVVGVNKAVTMIPLKISHDAQGSSTISTMISGVNYAALYGIDILNLSYTLSSMSTTLEQAVQNYGGLFVSSAGNDGDDIDVNMNGHCNNVQNWIVVGATQSNDTRASFSNYGATYVDLFAPGYSVYSTKRNNTYGSGSGTSFAAPLVVAAAAVLMAHATDLSVIQIKDLLLNNVAALPALSGLCVTGGRLSLINAVNALYSATRPAYSKGDVNGSGTITSSDSLIIKRIYLGTYTPTPKQLVAADVNKSGTVTSIDYIMVVRYCNETYYFPPY